MVKKISDYAPGDTVPHPDDPNRLGRTGIQDKVDVLRDKEAALIASGRIMPSKVTALNVKAEPTVVDDIIETLEGLLAAIKSGEIEPAHLIIGYGERVATVDGGPENASSYLWDAIGLDVFQVVGHLQSYAIRLSLGEGHE